MKTEMTPIRCAAMSKMALDSDPELCSRPTISRLENLPDARALSRFGRAMVDIYCESYSKFPKPSVLDIEDAFDAVHGGPETEVHAATASLSESRRDFARAIFVFLSGPRSETWES